MTWPDANLSPLVSYPELLITVNYTAVGLSSVQVFISLSNITWDVVSQTTSIELPSGVNLMGVLHLEFRQLFKSSVSFGLFDVSLCTLSLCQD